MRKWFLLLIALLMALILTGCGQQPEAEPEPTPTAEPVIVLPTATPAPILAAQIDASGALADAARKLMEPYQAQLNAIAAAYVSSLSYTIPSDLLQELADSAAAHNTAPTEGRYQFMDRQTSNNTWQTLGLEVLESLDDSEETDRQDIYSGDFVAAGGGNYERIQEYDVAENLSEGSITITEIFNGSQTGHEIFRFIVQDGCMIFADATLDDLSVNLDTLDSTGSYLITLGSMKPGQIDLLEYHAAVIDALPDPLTQSWETMIQQAPANDVYRLACNDEGVTEQ